MESVNKERATALVARMMESDHFSAWLGIEVLEVDNGYCKLAYSVRKDMLNGFGQVHGGVLFSCSDSAFAFACNSYGLITVALDVSISFTKAVKEGERLVVVANELHRGNKTGVYDIRTTNADGQLVAVFKGTAYQTSRVME